MDDVDMTICSAIFLRRPTTFISLVPTLLTDLGADGLEPPVARAASRSDCWILPPLPLPTTIERSIPVSLARLLTAGLASTVLFAALGAVAVGVTAGLVGWGDRLSSSFSSVFGASGMASSLGSASTMDDACASPHSGALTVTSDMRALPPLPPIILASTLATAHAAAAKASSFCTVIVIFLFSPR